MWAIAGIVVVGGGAYIATNILSTGSSESPDENSADIVAKEESGGVETFSGSLRQLLARGQNVTCDFAQEQDGASVTGTAYVAGAGSRVRVDYAATASGYTMTGSTIHDGSDAYVWGNSPIGTFAIKTTSDEQVSESKTSQQGIDLEQSGNYSCSPWVVDASKFELPEGIEFKDMAAQIQAATTGVDLKAMQCGACDQIPDAGGKAQCKAALGCK